MKRDGKRVTDSKATNGNGRREQAHWLRPSRGSEMGDRMRAMNWDQTSLGPIWTWPQSLRTVVGLCLTSRYPMCIFWGPDLVQLYNDAYRPVLGASKHPSAFGQPGRQTWPEIWDIIGPMFEDVVQREKSHAGDDTLFLLDRHGYIEETYFNFSYDPIRDDDGTVGGVFVACQETTERVLSERRLQTLRDVGETAGIAKSDTEACSLVAQALRSNPSDVPIAMLYLFDDAGTKARLISSTRLAAQVSNVPIEVPVDQATDVWGSLLRSASLIPRECPLPGSLQFADFPPDYPFPTEIFSLSLPKAGSDATAGVLLVGKNPRRAVDERYRSFLTVLARTVSSAMSNARARDEERKRAESLAALDRAKTTFFSNISHEFRTPLTLILGPLEELKSALDAGDALSTDLLHGQVNLLHRNSLRLLKLVNTLLEFSRIEAGRVRASFERVDLAALTVDLASVFRSAVEKAGITFVVDCPPTSEPAFVDRAMWEKIVLNLLSNAFKFTFTGEIAITLRLLEGEFELEVRDSGTGIPADQIDKIFDRFHRVPGATGRTHEGTGIGLALVKELVNMHRGSVSARSESGVGTILTVRIPRGVRHLPEEQLTGQTQTMVVNRDAYVEEAMEWISDDESTPMNSAGALRASNVTAANATILIADDNADMRTYVRRLLEEEGFHVETCVDGESAFERSRTFLPDVVLADVMMPRLDGFGLLRKLRQSELTASIPVIMLSARAGEEARLEGLSSGADDYLVKPFSSRELVARVRNCLELYRLRQQFDEERRALVTVFTQTPIPIAILRGDNLVFEMVNPAYARVVGDRDIMGKPCLEAFPELKGQGFDELLREVMRSGTPYIGREQHAMLDRTGNGSPTDTYWTFIYAPLKDGSGEIRRVIVVANEVTDQITARKKVEELAAELTSELAQRRETEKELRTKTEQLSGILENAALGLYWVDEEGIILWANGALLRMLGYSQEEFVGRPLREFYTGENVMDDILASHRNGRPLRDYRASMIARDGNLRTVLIDSSVLTDGDVFIHTQCFTRDVTEQTIAEEQLRRRLEEFEALINTVPVGIGVARDPECQFIWGNPAFNKMLRTNEGENISKSAVKELPFIVLRDGKEISGEDLPMQQACRLRTEIQNVELEIVRRDGTRIHELGFATPLFDGNGNVRGCIGAFMDVTERRRIMDTLKQREEYLRAIIETSPECVKMVAADGTLLEMNAAGCELIEAESADDVIGKSIYDVIAPEFRGRFTEMNLRVCAGSKQELEFEIIGLRGSRRWMETHAVPILYPKTGEMVQLAISRDITHRKHAEDSLRQSETLFRQLADSMPQIVWTARPDGYIDYFNKRWYEYTGFDKNFGEESWKPILHPDDVERSSETYFGCIRSQTPYEIEYRFKDRMTGGYRWFLGRALPIRDTSGRIIRWFGTCTDIDDQKRAEERLEEAVSRRTEELVAANRELEAFSYSVSHDLRAPLRAISGYSGLLLADLPHRLTEEERRRLHLINKSANDLGLLVDGLLTFSRLSRQNTSRINLDMKLLVEAVLQDQLGREQRAVSVTLHDLPCVVGDGLLMRQLFTNLISNALKFTKTRERPAIEIGSTREQNETVFYVKDNGVGFDMKFADKLFGVFERLHRAEEFDGTGIGLAFTKRIVERHGGRIWAEAEVDKGATFYFSLKEEEPA